MRKVLLFFVLLVHTTLVAQTVVAPPSYSIGISTGSFTPPVQSAPQLNFSNATAFEGKNFKLIQFYQIPSDSERSTWADQGLFLSDYLPGNAYFAVISAGFNPAPVLPNIRAVLDIDGRFKQEAAIYLSGIPANAQTDGQAELIISYFATLSADAVLNDLEAKGFSPKIHDEAARQILVTLDTTRLAEMTALPYVQFINLPLGEPVLEGSDHENSSGRTNYLNTGYNGLNFNGSGVALAIGESGALVDEIDVKGRITEQSSGVSSHKVGVMQNCTGAGNLNPTARNNAWGATVYSTDGTPNYATLFTTYNVLYINHSYGIGSVPNGSYDATARAHDLRIATYPNQMVIYSAGNSGAQTGYTPYNFPTWATITGGMKMNKNMLSVGALTPGDVLTSFSSRGPMYDGRIIPQLVIEGQDGTSNAAPKMTGISAILAQVYKSFNSGNAPSSTLLRAIMLNTADDIGNAGPDFKTGYGRINVRRAYHMIQEGRFLNGTVSHGNTNTHTITVPANTRQLRAMIVWNDVAAAVNANPAIVNDLDMVAKDPGNTPYNPWVLDHTLPSSDAKLNSVATRSADHLNTIEQITIDDPQAGAWNIDISGYNVPSGPQSYQLSWEFLQDELHFMFPLKNHRLEPNETYYLRWDSYGVSGTFSLDYQIDNGSWVNIVKGHDASSRVYSWIAPVVNGIHTIKFRVKRGSLMSVSDVNYIGKVPENLRITKICNDEVTLKWGQVAGATAYKVYKLGAQYMEEVTSNITFSGNSAVLTGQSTSSNEYYAVSALTGSNEGQLTGTITKTPGDYNCTGIEWTGAVSTDWFTSGNWANNAVPTASTNISIPSAPANQPQINAAGAVCGNITIQNGASLTMNNATAYTLSVAGDWTNNGTFTSGIGTVHFNGSNVYQEITGTSTTSFYLLQVTKGAIDNILEATSPITLTASSVQARLILVSGTFKLSNSASNIVIINSNGTDTNNALGSGKRVWVSDGTMAVNSSWRLNAGELKVSGGTLNVGNADNALLDFLNNGRITIEGGHLNVSAGIFGNSTNSSGTFNIYGGTITVGAFFNGYSRPAFEMNTNCIFNMSGGTIVVRRRSTESAGSDYFNAATNYTVSGGTLQAGSATTPTSQTIRINSLLPVYNFVVNNTNNPTVQLLTNTLMVKNDLTITGGTLNANNLDINVGGHWTNSGTFVPGTGTVTFNGCDLQTINGTGNFSNIKINKPEGAVTLNTPTNISGVATFQSGIVNAGATNLFIFNSGASHTGASNASHVSGPVRKIGNTAFTFPVGKSGYYRPASISAPGVTTDHFTTEYFFTHPTAGGYPTTQFVSPIQYLSECEYWTINRTNGNSNVLVTLSYQTVGANGCSGVTDQPSLLVARWDGGQWVSHGNGGTTGEANNGTVVTSAPVTSFSPFTLASSAVSLPVELLSFEATPKEQAVVLDWRTAMEINNDYFTVEKSRQGTDWAPFATVDGAGQSFTPVSYTAVDPAPFTGTSYYRLKQTDFDGQYTYSDIRAVYMNGKKQLIGLYPNPARHRIQLSIGEKADFTTSIFDAYGQLVLYSRNEASIDISSLAKGLYFVEVVVDGQSAEPLKLVVGE